MRFTQLVKTVDTNNYCEELVTLDKIKAQYNPERFHLWKSLHGGPEKEVLNMIYSPHYRFLKDRNDKSYYKLQRLYGRNNKWVQNKVNKFISVFDSIKNDGYEEKIIILSKPLIKNIYNSGFEIFEGHHRVACCLILGMKEIICRRVMI